MSGDIGIEEQAIVLTPQATMAAREASTELTKAKGHVTHIYGPRVVIGEVQPEARAQVRSAIAEAEMFDDAAALEKETPEGAAADLDELGALGLKAFGLRQSTAYAEAKANRPYQDALWDRDEGTAPVHDEAGAGEADAEGTALAAFGTTSERINGSIAVGIIIVSGPGDLAFTVDEQTKVVAEVQNGLGWLGGQNNGGEVSWNYDIHHVSLTTPANPTAPDLEAV